MHLYDCKDSKIQQFSEASWVKFVNSSLQWASLQGPEREIAERAVETFNLRNDSEIPDKPSNIGYHRQCYMQYCNVRNIENACKKKEKTTQKTRGLQNLI